MYNLMCCPVHALLKTCFLTAEFK